MHLYRILPGKSFRLADGTLKEAGDTVELASDVAATHSGSVELVPETPPAQTAERPAE